MTASNRCLKKAWMRDKKVMDLPLPPGLLLAVIQRKNDIVVPRGNTVIKAGDRIVLGAEGYHDDVGINLKEIVLKEHHPWAGNMIKDLDISRQTLIVMVRRKGKVMIPNGSMRLLPGTLCCFIQRRTLLVHAMSVSDEGG